MEPQRKDEFEFGNNTNDSFVNFGGKNSVTYTYKKSANDNYANDNNEGSKSRLENAGSAIKSTGTAMKATGATTEVAGAGVQAAGKGIDLAGKGLQAGGRGMISAGTALSSTGVGAIVGVPLAIAGGATTVAGVGTQAVGKGTQAAGRATRRVGRGVRRTGGQVGRTGRIVKQLGRRRAANENVGGSPKTRYLNRATNLIPNPAAKKAAQIALKNVKKVEATSLNIEILSWATPFWLFFIFPAAIVSLVLGGATYFFHDYLPGLARDSGIGGEIIYSIGSFFVGTFNAAMEYFFGFSADPTGWFLALNSIVFFMYFGVLIIMAIQYTFAGISCFFGKGSVFKIFTFIIAIFGSLLPFFNMFPWFMLWAAAVNINPE